MSNPGPIGLFDSGVGGLSVMREIRLLLPTEDLLYFADSAHCPYGIKPPEAIRQRAIAICDFLISNGVKIIVVACNTMSIVGLDFMRDIYKIPIVGIEPAVKPAAAATQNGKIGILATNVTIAGDRFNSLVQRFGEGLEVMTQPCPGLVELVETGNSDSPEAETLMHRYLDPLLDRGIDTVVLGCTHYPFLRPLVESIAGPKITIIDTGEAVARQTTRILSQYQLSSPMEEPGHEYFYTSGNPEKVTQVIKRLWGDPDAKVRRVNI